MSDPALTKMPESLEHETMRTSIFEFSVRLDQAAERDGACVDAVGPPLAPDATSDAMNDKNRAGASRAPGSDQSELLLEHDAFERAQRIASGRLSAADQAWLSKAFSAFLVAGGSLPLERCLGLPRNDCAMRRACRDYWLRRAWKALGENPSPWRRSERLAAAIRDFRTRQWLRWRTLQDPPLYANHVEIALFQAFRSSERIPSTAMQLHNIAYHRRHS